MRAAQLYIFHKSSQSVLRKTTKTEVFVKKTLTEGVPDYKIKYITKLFNKVLTKVTFTQKQQFFRREGGTYHGRKNENGGYAGDWTDGI